jgi:antitoxin MazE
MEATIKKWGNSAAVRIPSAILEAANLRPEDVVNVREENGRIVIEPVLERHYNLDQLLSGITPENLHGEVSFGPAVGKEKG